MSDEHSKLRLDVVSVKVDLGKEEENALPIDTTATGRGKPHFTIEPPE
jgi:hypothetical protein